MSAMSLRSVADEMDHQRVHHTRCRPVRLSEAVAVKLAVQPREIHARVEGDDQVPLSNAGMQHFCDLTKTRCRIHSIASQLLIGDAVHLGGFWGNVIDRLEQPGVFGVVRGDDPDADYPRAVEAKSRCLCVDGEHRQLVPAVMVALIGMQTILVVRLPRSGEQAAAYTGARWDLFPAPLTNARSLVWCIHPPIAAPATDRIRTGAQVGHPLDGAQMGFAGSPAVMEAH